MDAGDGKVARNGGYVGSGRSIASGGRFLREPVLVSRGGEFCVERRCSRIGSCGCLPYTNVLEDRGDDIGIFDAGDDAQFAAALGGRSRCRWRRRVSGAASRSWGQGAYPAFRGAVCVLALRTRDACNSANTPWNRVRFNRGRGTKAARRAMESAARSGGFALDRWRYRVLAGGREENQNAGGRRTGNRLGNQNARS